MLPALSNKRVFATGGPSVILVLFRHSYFSVKWYNVSVSVYSARLNSLARRLAAWARLYNRLPELPWNYRPFHQLLMTWSPKTDDWVEFDIHWPIWSFFPQCRLQLSKPKKTWYRSTITNPHKSRVLSNHEISPIIYLFTTQKNNLTRRNRYSTRCSKNLHRGWKCPIMSHVLANIWDSCSLRS